jgi:hypothetical protein
MAESGTVATSESEPVANGEAKSDVKPESEPVTATETEPGVNGEAKPVAKSEAATQATAGVADA